jgi:hypothetical protein
VVGLQRPGMTDAVLGLGRARLDEAAAGPQPRGTMVPYSTRCHGARGEPYIIPCALQDTPSVVLSFTPTADATLALEAGPYDAANRIGIVPAAGDICLIQVRGARCARAGPGLCMPVTRTRRRAWCQAACLSCALARPTIGRADERERTAACCRVTARAHNHGEAGQAACCCAAANGPCRGYWRAHVLTALLGPGHGRDGGPMRGAGAAGRRVVRRSARRHAALCGDVQHHVCAAQRARGPPLALAAVSSWMPGVACGALLPALASFRTAVLCAGGCASWRPAGRGVGVLARKGVQRVCVWSHLALRPSCPYNLVRSARGAGSVEAWP